MQGVLLDPLIGDNLEQTMHDLLWGLGFCFFGFFFNVTVGSGVLLTGAFVKFRRWFQIFNVV